MIGTNADGSNDSAEGNVLSGGGNGIVLNGTGTSGARSGNLIGTDATGLLARGNTYDGIRIENGATGNYVGGSGSARRNIIAGNGQDGVQVDGEASDGNFIQNNYIGLASDGVTVIGNGGDGIFISGGADNTTIGGVGLGNVIMGSRVVGIEIDGASSGTTIYGNYIGINVAGTVIQGSGENGILLENSASSTTIGGTTAGQGNTVVDSGRLSADYQAGVSISATAGTGNSVIGNSIYDNRGHGIDLGYEGADSNDSLDPDTGANNLQNYPSLSSVTTNGSTVTISGSLNSLASTAGILIHFYATPSGGSTTTRQAKRYLGSTTVNTDASGNATFTNVALSSAVSAGELVTATATVGTNTSELSQSFVATSSSGNSTPTSLAVTSTIDGGLNFNSGSGNNVYLEAEDGGTLLGGRTQLSMEFDFQAEAIGNQRYTLASYTTTTDGDALFIGGYKNGGTEILEFQIGGSVVSINYDLDTIFDGNRHALAFTWNQSGGTYVVYLDGVQIGSGTGLATGLTIATNGTLAFGQDMDNGTDTWQAVSTSAFKGTLYDVRIFSDVRTATEIASSYRSTLSYTESGMIANWKMNDLSTEGTITETVSGNDLTVRQITGSSFTSSTPSLTLSVTENAFNGTVVGNIYGTDLDRESKITALLSSDLNLRYNAETGKFYKLVSSAQTWSTAQSNAIATSLGGVAGQLLTISNASENAFATELANNIGASVWLGLSDQTTEGAWYNYSGSSASNQVWQGTSSGYRVNGAYSNWSSGEPNDSGGEDHAELLTTGKWNDAQGTLTRGYVIEWNADDVLDATNALTYSIVSQSASGAFTINSDSGVITVADSSKLNYESATSQTVTVRVADGSGAFYDKTFTITLSDVSVEPTNSVPSTQTVNEDTSLVFSSANGNAITITDQNAGTNSTIQVTLSVASGTLTLSQTTGLTIVSGSNGSSSMVLNGTESNINAALNGLTFAPTSNYNGSLNLQISTAYHADMNGWYTFNDGTANDQSAGTTQNGSFVGNATTISDPTRGTVLALDGTGDSVAISSTFGNPTNVTIGGWVNLNTSSGRSEFISLDNRVHIALDESGTGIKGSIQTGASSWTDLTSGRFIAGTGWHHVMYVYDDTNNVSTLYIDGQVAATATITSSIYWTGATTTYIGQHPTNTAWNLNGKADDVRIYTRALTSAEVSNLAAGMSVDTDTVSINVTSINDAPVLDNSGTMIFTSITEDQTNNSGQTVASIISSAGGDRITDVDSGAVEGIALTSWSGSGGTWQYSTDNGSNWNNVGPVSSTSALLLRSTDLIRFVPDGLAGTSGSLSFSAWDQSSGTAGTYADASTTGGSTAYSSATETASITVTSVDDAPTFASGSGRNYTSIAGMQFGNAIAQQNDGKYVIAGWTDGGGTRDFIV
ncbi:MAG: LamG-like jellyroll fold domain-containing protein, partial [Pirellulales bacterium]